MKAKRVFVVVGLVAALALLPTIFAAAGEQAANKGPGEYCAAFEQCGHFFTMMSGMKMGDSLHKEVQIWYSSNIKRLIDKQKFVVPVGTVAIKKFNNDGKPGVDGMVVMIKKEPGYDSAHNDWYYEMRDAKGELVIKDGKPMAGKIEMCISCHATASDKDYLLGTGLR